VSSAAEAHPRLTATALRQSPARWRWLWPYIRRELPTLAWVLATAALASLLSIALPLFSKQIVDRGLIARDFPVLLELCGAVVILAMVSFAVGGLNRWLYVRASGRILFSLREDVYGHLLALPPEFFRQRAAGDLVTRLDGDVAEIQRFSTDTLLVFINGTLLLVATAAIMIALCWPLALIAGAVLPVQLALRHRVRPLLAERTKLVREQASGIAHFLFETLSAVKAVQSLTAEAWERARLNQLNRDYLGRLLSLQLLSYSLGGLSGLLSHAATAAVFMYGGYRVIGGTLTIGTLIAFVAYMARSTGSAMSLLNLYTAYQRAAVSLDRVEELLHAERAIDGGHAALGSQPGVRGNGAITLERVSLGATTHGRCLLEDCTLDIPAGAKVVIAGNSGVGKSTLVDALTRFVPLDDGRILLDGTDIAALAPGELRRQICVLTSEPAIFRGSVLDNLRYGSFDCGETEVRKAAGRAGLDTVVATLPNGYASLIGSGGQGISTGQRQRIAIARALLRDPLVLVLDEALAPLDLAAALELHALLDEAFAGRTRIVISHSPERVPRADLCLELSQGKLFPRGHQIRDRGLQHDLVVLVQRSNLPLDDTEPRARA
jgi:ATP-binding cassette subfamily B protein